MAIHSLADLDFDVAAAQSVIAVDTETNNKDLRDGRGYALGLSISYLDGTKQISVYVPFRHMNGTNASDEYKERVKTLLLNAEYIVFHNAKFDLESLRSLGINYTGKFFDTMLMGHMIDENIWSKGLDAMTKMYLGDPGKDRSQTMSQFIAIMGWEAVTPELIYEYASYDADLTLRLFYDRAIPFASQGFDSIWPVEQKFTRALGNMERRGIKIDQQVCKTEGVKGKIRMAEITKELKMNPGSTKDLKKLLIDELKLPVVARTPKGDVSFNKVAMEAYDAYLEEYQDNQVASLVLEYRGWQKTVSSNYDSYLELLSPDGRLRPNYKIHGTVTGRLSCEKPNLQQIPRQSDKPWNGNLKAAFIPATGFRLLEADYSQIEFRLAAAYSKDENLIETFNSGHDIFTEMAAELHMKRQDVKTLTYATLYGGGLTRLSFLFKVSQEEAAILRNRYFNAYPGLKAISNKSAKLARANGYVPYWTGRRRHFRDPQEEGHKAFNAIVQGGASEIVKRALIQCDEEYANNPDVRLLLTVHDSLVFEVREDQFDEVSANVIKIMEQPEGVPDFGVRLNVAANEWGKKD